jgi:hypothetical protein
VPVSPLALYGIQNDTAVEMQAMVEKNAGDVSDNPAHTFLFRL